MHLFKDFHSIITKIVHSYLFWISHLEELKIWLYKLIFLINCTIDVDMKLLETV